MLVIRDKNNQSLLPFLTYLQKEKSDLLERLPELKFERKTSSFLGQGSKPVAKLLISVEELDEYKLAVLEEIIHLAEEFRMSDDKNPCYVIVRDSD